MKISTHNLGLALLMLCLIQMASQSALVKAIGDTFSSAQIVFIRGAVGLLLIIPFVWRYRFVAFQFSNLRLHLLRALFGDPKNYEEDEILVFTIAKMDQE